MEKHPIRERHYLPVTKFGVAHTDWKWVFITTMAGFILPVLANLWIGALPVFLITGPGALIMSVIFFNFIRIGKRPYWFSHKIKSLLRPKQLRPVLPMDQAVELIRRRDN